MLSIEICLSYAVSEVMPGVLGMVDVILFFLLLLVNILEYFIQITISL